MSNKNYSIEELVQNSGFRRMVKGTATSEEISYWDNWIEENDQNRRQAMVAKSEIIGFEFNDPAIPDMGQQWSKLHVKTSGSDKRNVKQKKSSIFKMGWFIRAAAVFVTLCISGLVGVYLYDGGDTVTHLEQLSEEKTIVTAADEQKTLLFSNGSSIILGGNSSLTYSIGLLQNQSIDVTLEGEAWFDAESDPLTEEPVFTVNTPDGIIRDIGTKFMVTVQKDRSRVVLQEGYVEVGPVGEDNSNSTNEWFDMQMGELVEFNSSEIIKREVVNTSLYTSWATGFVQFNRTTLDEFSEYMEDRFDVKVQIVDKKLMDVTLDGAVYFRSLEGLVRSVSEVLSIPVYQSEVRDIVFIGNPNE